MRTASANKILNFLQNMEIDSEFISSQRDGEIDGLSAHSNPLGLSRREETLAIAILELLLIEVQ